jgi:hypothetical protein
LFPAEGGRRLHRHAARTDLAARILVLRRLRVEQFEARHGDHACFDAFGLYKRLGATQGSTSERSHEIMSGVAFSESEMT